MQYTCPMHPEIIRDKMDACPLCGMALEPMTISAVAQPNVELMDMSKRFWISVLLTIPILFLTMGAHVIGLSSIVSLIPAKISAYLQFILATPVIFWCGSIFLKRGVISIIERHLNMFTLIALGVSVSYFYSVIALLFPHLFPSSFHQPNDQIGLYFEAAAVITALVLMGQVLELRGREQTSGALRALLDLTPQTARKIDANGVETEMTLDKVQVDDLLKVRPGEKIPVDGKIIEGHGVIDESMVTGESIPAEKEKNALVIGGTFNISGSFIMSAQRVGSDTMLSQIIHQVSQAQRSRAPIQKLADYIASLFVPIVLLIAVITFLIWLFFGPNPTIPYALISAISVLIIACPCALGLATPMSIMVGMGRGAQAGILIKDAQCLEQFEKVNVLIVDKTGTLTTGKPTLKKIIPINNFNANDILFLAASLENNSEHPLANAIVQAARENNISLSNPTEFSADIGKGIRGIIEKKSVALGNKKLLESLHIDSTSLTDQVKALQNQGDTVMFVVIENQIAGLLCVSDPIKTTTPAALKSLRNEGVDIVMLTGDNRITAEAIAKDLGINTIFADVLPQEKNAVVKELRKNGRVVAMAGDGINDASALAEADVGIAMGTGTDIAMKSAGITLIKGDLMGIVRAKHLSRKVMRNIRENLFLAFAYNMLCIPIAAGILYPSTGLLLSPMIAALAMSLSSASVIANALRLRRK